MKKLIGAILFVWSFLFATGASAVTVYYQPTPYPLWKMDGSLMPQYLNIVHIHDGWMNSYYPAIKPFQRDDKLQVGGWGDVYNTYIQFDLTGLPSDVTQSVLWLMPFSRGDNSTPTGVDFWWPPTSWDTTMTWDNQPAVQYPQDYYGGRAAPTVNQWWGTDITSIYRAWKNGTWTKNGLRLEPWLKNNNFDVFRSSRYADYVNDPYADGKRPILGLTFTPTLELKMPLPGGYSWLLTNEIGGYEFKGESPWPDTAHGDGGSNGNYYSIDISWKNNGSTYGQYNTPVLAASGGKVIEVGGGNNPGDLNGFYVVIDHDSDGQIITGFTTRYLHLKQAAARANGTLLAVGNSVNQGDQIGIMGTTGKDASGNPTSTAEHLHFGVRYQNKGYSYTTELTKAIMEGKLLKSYQTECAVNSSGVPTSRIRYYTSTIVPTGI